MKDYFYIGRKENYYEPIYNENYIIVHTYRTFEIFNRLEENISCITLCKKEFGDLVRPLALAKNIFHFCNFEQKVYTILNFDIENNKTVIKNVCKGLRFKPLSDSYYIIGSKKTGIFKCKQFADDKVLWEKKCDVGNHLRDYELYNDKLIASNSDWTKKYCFDIKTGEEIWSFEEDDYPQLSGFTTLGRNKIIGDKLLGYAKVNIPFTRAKPDRTWFANDIETGKLLWVLKIETGKNSIDKMGMYHSIFLDEKDEEFYYMVANFNIGKIVSKTKITDQLKAIKSNTHDLYDLDLYVRAIHFDDGYLYFGLERRYIQMNIETLEMRVLYEGKSVFDSTTQIDDYLFIKEMIGGLILLKKGDSEETELERLFKEET